MSFFSKRSTALLLAAVMVIASTLLSVKVKFGEQVRQLNYGFYDGVYTEGYRQKGIGDHLKNICAYADGLVTIANNYELDTEDVRRASEDLKLGLTYSPEAVSYLYYCYDELTKAVDVMERRMEQEELSERDQSGLEQYMSSINGAKSAIESSGYNKTVRDFLKRYDHFPTDALARLSGVEMPQYFTYG